MQAECKYKFVHTESNYISTFDSLNNSRLHFYSKIYSVKDISNFRYSIQKIITLIQCVQIYITNSVCTNLY
jgi:hypothetical protein